MSFYNWNKDPKPSMEDKHHKTPHYNGGKDINILILGVKGVGKSALTVRYLTRRFIGDYDSELETIYSHSMVVDGKTVNVHILDTAWNENGADVKEDQIVWADAIMLVYSMTDRKSFEKVKEIADTVVSKKADDKVVMALVANKCDLLHRKQISDTEATQFCAEYNTMFFETSASDSYSSVVNAFSAICRQVKHVYKKREKLTKFMQNPAVAAKLQIRNSLRSLAEMKWRSRTSTM